MSNEAPQPLAQGDLARTPLAHVVLSITERALDGTLALWPEDGRPGQDRVLFQQGVPIDARLLEPAATLERGLLPLFQRKAGPYAFYASDLVGETKVRGAVDPFALIAASLRGGARREVVDAVLARFGEHPLRVVPLEALGRFDLLPKEKASLDVLRAEPRSAPAFIASAVDEKVARRLLYLLAITKQLEIFSGEVGRRSLTEVTTGGAAATGASPSAKPAVDEFAEAPAPRAAASSDDFAEVTAPAARAPSGASTAPRAPAPTSSPSTRRTPEGGRRPGDPEPVPDAPAGLSPELAARWQEIAARAVAIEDQNYFQMLGVSQTAGPDEVRAAYFKLVKQWHPDRLAPDLQALKLTAERIFRYLTEAHDTLAEVEKRGTYLKNVQGGAGTPRAERALQAVLEAALQFQKVDVLLRRRDFAGALRLVDEILALAPDEADYHAARGQVLFKQHGVQDKVMLAEATRALDAALARDERCERALTTKAELLQRTGKERESFALWRKAHDLYPKNVEAQRMVRLARMRGTSSSSRPPPPDSKRPPSRVESKRPPKGDDGLLSKLFGKKK